MRPAESGANTWKRLGVISTLCMAQPSQRSTTVAVARPVPTRIRVINDGSKSTESVKYIHSIEIVLPQRGLLLELPVL
jgi:hypothetical protein